MHKIKLPLLLCLLFLSIFSLGQSNVRGWHLLDVKNDSFSGISLQKAYEYLKGKKYTPVIVAVIDSGVDTAHEDLKNMLWHNPKEVPRNGVDDDKNGYTDDIYGWNFLGNKNGENLKKDVDERTRVYYRYKDKFEGKEIDEDSLGDDEKWQYSEWKKAAAQMKVNSDDDMQVMFLEVAFKAFKKHDEILRSEMSKEQYTIGELENFQPQTEKARLSKMGYITCAKLLGIDSDETNTGILKELSDYIDGKKLSIENKTTRPADYRAQIIKDNYFDINDRYYGNNNVMGPEPMHGTHVCGIIAAQRNNNIGTNGIADHVQIMMLRAVPDGDEYDKDVALAIKYAVDNGAKIINMSFGKSFSPEKKWVDEAVRYAELHDVLLVHAAGNESHNVDSSDNFPNANLITFKSTATNFINVGASGDLHVNNGKIIADFSNYGKNSVDVFAPGVKIYSTLPVTNQYGFLSGTSMAAPVVSGVAALIRSYFPGLSAAQVKYAIEQSAFPLGDTSAYITQFITGNKIKISELSKTNGLVNADAAIELAATLKPEKPALLQTGKPPVLNNPKEKKP